MNKNSSNKNSSIDKYDKLLLIRKGNELFNKGNIKLAAKIFLTTGYKDGLIRIGDYYLFEKRDVAKALKYYKLSGYKKREELLAENIANLLKVWLKEK